MKSKLVSVIIAAYNADSYIATCIESIINQTYDNWEIWICNDASTDKTELIIKEFQDKYENIHMVSNEHNMFAAYSRNRCIENSKGEYIVVQDADDVAESNRLEVLVKAIEEAKCDFVSSGHFLFDEKGIYQSNIPKVSQPQKKDFLYDLPFCHAATLFTKDCLTSVNGYRVSKETRRGQDYDLFMRLYAAGYRGINIPDLLYGYRVDRDTIARRKFRYRLDECIIRYKGFKALKLMPIGLLYVLKPIPAHFLQLMKNRRKL